MKYKIHRSKHGHGEPRHYSWQLHVNEDVALVYETWDQAVNAMNGHAIMGGAGTEGLVGVLIKHVELTHPDGSVAATDQMFLEEPWQSLREAKNEARRRVSEIADRLKYLGESS